MAEMSFGRAMSWLADRDPDAPALVFEGRTVIVVASRVSSVRDCEQIVVLDEGEIVERGTHAELLANEALYARLAREQEQEPCSAGGAEVA